MGSEAGVLRIALCDEGTSTENFAVHMLLAALASVLDKDIRLGIVGDACQLMLETLGWRSDDSEQLLDLWKKVVETLQRSSIVSEPVATEPVNWWSAATSFTARAPLFSTPMCYGGHCVIFLGNMRSLLRLKQHDPDAHTWVWEVRCRV